MISPARVAAYKVLLGVSSGRADLSSALAAARASLSDERDRALVSAIATGVQRRRAALDHLIVQFSKRPIARLDAQVVEILRLSLYQLIHLTRVPAPAVVDDAVSLTRKTGKSSAGGFVNAVLRAAVRGRKNLPLPERPADTGDVEAVLDYFATTLSHPRWIAARWLSRYGFDAAETWLRFNNEPAPLTLRANPLRTTRDALAEALAAGGVRTRPGQFAPDALIVEEGRPTGDGFLIQDEASQLVTLLAGSAVGPRVLDACASPGNKTIALAAALSARSGSERTLLVACDVRARRMDLLRRTVSAAGAPGVALVQASLSTPLPFHSGFDLVFVDMPCSGLGTLRRDPDIRWRRSEADLNELAASERRMLANAAGAVRSGGRLVYATCSSEPEENDQVVDSLLATDTRFSVVDARTVHPAIPPSVVDERGYFRTTPHVHGLEAFFGAVLEKRTA